MINYLKKYFLFVFKGSFNFIQQKTTFLLSSLVDFIPIYLADTSMFHTLFHIID